MAAQTVSPSPTPRPSAQVIGNAFVQQYFHILYHTPHLAHRFYRDKSLFSRPDPDGLMTTVTTMEVSMIFLWNSNFIPELLLSWSAFLINKFPRSFCIYLEIYLYTS